MECIGLRGWGLQPNPAPESGKATFFGQTLNFFGQKPAAKNEKNSIFIKRKNEIHSAPRDEVPEIRDFY